MSWVNQFTQTIQQGVWLPRWLPDSNGGYGSPVFVFYSPLVYYVTALLQLTSGSLILSMKLVRGLGLFLSGLAMLVYASDLVDKRTALAIAVVYIAIPFHVLDICYWSLYAETWAWIWFPLILFFLGRIRNNRGGILSLLGLSSTYAALIVTHLISAYMFSLVMAVFWVVCWIKGDPPRQLWRMLAAILMGLVLSAFYLFPAFYERKFVRLEYSTLLPEFDFRNTFLFFPNLSVIRANAFQSKTIYLLQVVTVLQGIWLLLGQRLNTPKNGGLLRAREEMKFQIAIAILCFFLMTSLSGWIWDWVPGLSQIQFSTRWLSIYSLAVAIIAGMGFQAYDLHQTGTVKWMIMAHLTLAFAAGIASLLIVMGGCFLNDEYNRMAAANLYNAPEYNPKSMKYWKQKVVYPTDPPYTVLSGKAEITIKRWQSHDRDLTLSVEEQARIKFRLFYYPGWIASCDGQPIPTFTDPASGAMVVDVPKGFHTLQIAFQDTWWRKLALVSSALGAMGIFLLVLGKSRQNEQPA
jgi:hypothetical protein